jgi:hypothetical protein
VDKLPEDIQSEVYRPSDDPEFPGYMGQSEVDFDEVIEIDN